MYHQRGCTSIYRALSYPFRSLIKLPPQNQSFVKQVMRAKTGKNKTMLGCLKQGLAAALGTGLDLNF